MGALRRGALVILALATVAAWPASSVARSGVVHWRVAWASAMEDYAAPSPWLAHPTAQGAATPTDVTFRFIVRPTVSGTALRLRFSNPEYGAAANGRQQVSLAAVRVGVRRGSHGARLIPGTNRLVTFHGKQRVTIRSDGTALSDPVRLPVRASEDLAVSVYVPTSVVPAWHAQSHVTQYHTPAGGGNRTATSSAAAFTAVQEPIYWLDAVDVRSRAPRVIVALGDSITDGDQCGSRTAAGACRYNDDLGMNAYPTYPDFLARRIAAPRGQPETAVVNEGINGDSLAGLKGLYPGLTSRFARDVLDLPGVTDVILEIGTNDVTFGRPAAEISTGITKLVRILHQRGIRVIGATLVPRSGSTVDNPAGNAIRAQVNHFIRTSRIFDGVLDIAKAVGQPGDDNLYRPRYDSGDHLHPSTAGYRAIANALNLALLR